MSVFIDLSHTSFRLVCVHVFMLCLSIWSSDAWDSSVHRVRHQSTPTLKGAMRHQMAPGGGVSLFILLSNPQGYRHREMSKAATCHIGLTFSCVLSWVTVWLRFSSRSSLYSYHTDLFSDSGNGVFLHRVCIAVRQSELTVMMSSHPCAVICMCVWSLLLSSLFHAIVTEVELFDI